MEIFLGRMVDSKYSIKAGLIQVKEVSTGHQKRNRKDVFRGKHPAQPTVGRSTHLPQ